MLFDRYIRTVHIHIEFKAESNKSHFCPCSKTQVHMASKAFWAGIAYPSGAPEFTPIFSGVRVTRSLVLYVCFVGHCLSFCTFLLAIVLSVLRYTDFDYPFGIFKLLLHMKIHRNQIINISVFSHPISDGGCSIFSNYIYWSFHRLSCWWPDRWRRNQGSVNFHFYFH